MGKKKLTEKQVKEIKKLRAKGWMLKRLALKFGVTTPAIHHHVKTQK